MGHIADMMVEKTNSMGLKNHIARELSPHSPHDAVRTRDFLAASATTVSNKYIGYGNSPNRWERKVCLEDASTNRAKKIPAIPYEGQTINNSRTEEWRGRNDTINGAKWDKREGPINT
jgi:hypothetical protein